MLPTEEVKIVFTGENKLGPSASAADAEIGRLQQTTDRFNATAQQGFGQTGTKIGQLRSEFGATADSVKKTAAPMQQAAAASRDLGAGLAKAGPAAKGAAMGFAALAASSGASLGGLKAMIGAVSTAFGPIGMLTGALAIGAVGLYEHANAAEADAKAMDKAANDAAAYANALRTLAEVEANSIAAVEGGYETLASAQDANIKAQEFYLAKSIALGQSETEQIRIQGEILRLKHQAVKSAEDETGIRKGESLEIERQIELLGIKGTLARAPARRSSGRGPQAPAAAKAFDDSATFEITAGSRDPMAAGIANEAELAALRHEGEAARLAETTGNDAQIHALRIRQIHEQAEARRKILEITMADGSEAEQVQARHDLEMGLIRDEMDLRQLAADEQSRIADEQAAQAEAAAQRIRDQMQLAQDSVDTIGGIHNDLSGKLSGWRSEQAAAEQESLANWTQQQEQRTNSQVAALDRQIAASSGNSRKIADLERQKAALQRASQQKIEKEQASHADRSGKIERRQKGLGMLLEGGMSTVKAATAFPVVPLMIGHAAAAAIAFAFGAATLAGGTPGAGGGVPALGSNSGSSSDRQFDEPHKIPGSSSPDKQGSQGKRENTGGGGSTYNGNVTNNYYSHGSIDQDAIEANGFGANKAGRTREFAGPGK